MTEFEMLRDWLSGQAIERKLNEISRQSGVNRRTIQRIVNNANYSVNLTTYSRLKAHMDRAAHEAAEPAAA